MDSCQNEEGEGDRGGGRRRPIFVGGEPKQTVCGRDGAAIDNEEDEQAKAEQLLTSI